MALSVYRHPHMAGFVKKTMGPWSSYCTFAHILENYLAKPQGIRYWPSLAYTGEAGSLTDTSLELGSDSFAKSRGWCFNVGLQVAYRWS